MRNATRLLGAACVLMWLPVSGARAQTLEDSCPDIDSDLGGLIGYLVDDDSEMGLPGATATVRFETEDGPTELSAETGLDGVYRLCGIPIGVALELSGSFATFSSAPMAHTMSDNFERIDLGISMVAGSGGAAAGAVEDRILMCPEQLGATRLFLCQEGWHLEQCEYNDLGTVRASRSGSGGRNANYEIMEQLHTEATRVGAHAILNPQARMDATGRDSGLSGQTGTGGEMVLGEITGQAVSFADPSCRGIG